jgi:membrane-associated phospholipid phosphatase
MTMPLDRRLATMRFPTIVSATVLALSLSAGASASGHQRPGNVVTQWNAITTEIMIADNRGVLDSRIYAMTQAAVHDAINAIQPRFESYTPGLPPNGGASLAAAVATAAANVLLALAPGQTPLINQRLAETLASIPASPARTAGIALGMQAAQAILARRQGDGADTPGAPLPPNPANPNDPYVSTNQPGDYRSDTTPNFGFALYPSWGLVTPFVIDVPAHALPGPDALTSFAYAADFAYTKAIGGAVSTLRTSEQAQIAHFWFEGSPIGWNRIANNAIVAHGLDAWRAARVLALMNFAMADGFIAGWDQKYFHRFWRPETAIRDAGLDGNPLTQPDADWVAFLSSPTPPFFTPPLPDYPSTHTVLGAAAAEVLIAFFGDRYVFTATSTTLPGVTRRFRGFSAAAIENGLSRVYGGIHFVRAVVDGYRQGQGIGRVAAKQLKRIEP